mgnify:CR=1 FL=1
MAKTEELNVTEIWKEALIKWHHPSVSKPIAPKSAEELKELGELGILLKQELAFMKYPEAQVYLNLEKIASDFSEEPQKGLGAICEHEIGHRFCPYDLVTQIILKYHVKKSLEEQKCPYDSEQLIHNIYNYFIDMCINTQRSRKSNSEIPWLYQQLSQKRLLEPKTLAEKIKKAFSNKNQPKTRADSPLWRVYARSMESAWDKEILPKETQLSEEETTAATQLSELFKDNYFERSHWPHKIRDYARIIFPFMKDEKNDSKFSLDGSSGNVPKELDEKTKQELAKRLAEIGSNGLPTNPNGMKEFQEIMASFGAGTDIKEASIYFYDRLSDAYNVTFATKPFGRPRISPFQPVKWNPSKPIGELDIGYSLQTGGRVIPGVNTYAWNTRTRESIGGLEEVVPNLDIYLDSSQSMPNPIESISLPVIASFVVSKKAHRRMANVRGTNFSGNGQTKTAESEAGTLKPVFEAFVQYFNGGTVFPTSILLNGINPRQALIITDTFLCNEAETAEAIKQFRQQDSRNKVIIYALHQVNHADYLRAAGAEVIWDNSTNIFRKVIGKTDEVYSK